MRHVINALLVGSLAGCTGNLTGGPEGAAERDITPPTIEIHTPERGTLVEGTQVEVAGVATDLETSIASVTINGQSVPVGSDGRFSVLLQVTEGITLLESVASDAAGNKASDARAVLAGTLVPQETAVSDGVAAHLSAEAMGGLGDMVSGVANGTDFTGLAVALNPVVNTGDGCNSAKVYVESVGHSGVEVGAAPVTGGIDTDVSIRSLVVRGRVRFRALCIGGSASWTIRATAYDVGGRIAPTLADRTISIGLDGVTSAFRGFDLDVNNVPGFIENLFEGNVRDKLAQILRDKVREMVPSLANDFLAEFLADSWDVSLLGQTVSLSVWPSAMDWTEQGGTIVMDTSATVEGIGDALYLSNPRPRPADADMASTGLRIGLADDVLNQLLSAVWVSGALEDALLPADAATLSAAFGADVGSVSASMMLPPVASFDTTTGTARITIGDLIVDALGPAGEEVASFVMSAEIELAVQTSSDGRVKLVTRTPRILAQVLSQSSSLLTPLDNEKVAAIAELAIKQLSLKADSLLESLPVPGLADATIMSPTFQSAAGYLLMGGQLAF